MKKWNIAGLALFLIVLVVAIWTFIGDGTGEIPFLPIFAAVCAGILFAGLERFAGDTKYGVFLIALLWTGYWGCVSFGFFLIAGMHAFAVVFGHGGSGGARQVAAFLMYGYFVVALLFVSLATANLIRFFRALFSLPKLTNN